MPSVTVSQYFHVVLCIEFSNLHLIFELQFSCFIYISLFDNACLENTAFMAETQKYATFQHPRKKLKRNGLAK